MASGNGFMSKLRKFDAYPKTLEDFRVKTLTGATGQSLSSVLFSCPRFRSAIHKRVEPRPFWAHLQPLGTQLVRRAL